MSGVTSKRAASTSPRTSETRDPKRLCFASNLLTESAHQQQDREVEAKLENYRKWRQLDLSDPFDLGSVVSRIVTVALGYPDSDMRPVATSEDYAFTLEENPNLMDMVRKSVEANSFKDVRNFAFLRKNAPVASQTHAGGRMGIDVTGAAATLKSWEEAYVGSAADCLWDTLKGYCETGDPLTYARYAAIVQSSGMGKSRMIDELSKKHLVIPVNLRPEGDSGFPAADKEARKFLTGEGLTGTSNSVSTLYQSHAFLVALFEISADFLRDIDQRITQLIHGLSSENYPKTITEKFRLLMSADQGYSEQGPARRTFYRLVCERASKLFHSVPQEEMIPVENPRTPPRMTVPPSVDYSPSRIVKFPSTNQNGEEAQLLSATKALLKVLAPNLDLRSNLSKLPPMVIIAFDESHVLSDVKHNPPDGTWSKFSELRRGLRVLNPYPVFSVFLSTTGKTNDFTPAPHEDKSKRLEERTLVLLPPFTELGFDQMVQSRISDGSVTIDEVSTVEYMAMCGRPLFGARYKHAQESLRSSIVVFAAEKLIGGRDFPTTPEQIKNLDPGAKLACMAVRLALEFNATTLASQIKEREQVEKHMRVCLMVNQGFETAVTVAPSEPLLAEGAFLIMKQRDAFNLPITLLKELEGPGLDKGDRGELICLVLLILARDIVAQRTDKAAISLLDFIQALLAPGWHKVVLSSKPAKCRTTPEGNRSFEETFKNSRIYFNHFIKIHDPKIINRGFLWALIARGAAILCANNQSGMDVITPFVYWDAKLQRDNVSAIFFQVKNDKRYSTTPNIFLFDAMNPYFLRFFDMDEANPLPIIRIVFALAASDAGVEVIEHTARRQNPPRKAKGKKQKKMAPPFTAYDIWCAKASIDTFAVITPEEEHAGTYAALLKVGNVFPQAYEAQTTIKSAMSGRRNMNPGTAVHPDHWVRFAKISGEETDPVDIAVDYDFDLEVEIQDEDVHMVGN